jgi:hypothetical protein
MSLGLVPNYSVPVFNNLIFFVTNEARVFVTDQPFHPGVM